MTAPLVASVKEATQGYFHDFHKLRSHGGKTWRAPGTMIRDDVRDAGSCVLPAGAHADCIAQRSLYFPLMSGTRLADGKEIDTAQLLPGKVSIVAILTSAVSEVRTRRAQRVSSVRSSGVPPQEHTKSFYTAAFEAHGSHPAFQLVQVRGGGDAETCCWQG